MDDHLVFATSWQDAQETMETLGLDFNATVWVLNAQLLGDPSEYVGHMVHYSELFRDMPAYQEAVAIFGAEALPSDPDVSDFSI